MARELDLRLVATPTVELPNVGLGNLSSLTDSERATVRELASVAARRQAAKESKALPDGSFPIRNVPDLKKAVQAYGRAKNKPRVKRFIVRRARGLGRADLLPESWGVQPGPAAVLAAGSDGAENGIMVALYPPPELADRLAGGMPGDLTPDDLHVTLAYLGTTDDVTPEQVAAARDALANVAMRRTPFTAQVQGTGTFTAPESDDPHWYSVDAPGLAELRTEIVRALESVGVEPRTEHDFTPHMTVRYGGEQPDIPDNGDEPFGVHGLVLAVGGRREVYPLGHSYLSNNELEEGSVAPESGGVQGDAPDGAPLGDACLLCGNDEADQLHQQGTLPFWLDYMDNPLLAANNNEMVGADGKTVEFVAAPGPCSLDRSSKHNWVEQQGGLPNYICQVARAIARGGKSLDSAIPIAIGTLKRWAAGGTTGKGHKVSAAVQARAAAAIAEWEKKKAAAHASHGLLDAEATEFLHWHHNWIPADAEARAAVKAEKKAAQEKRYAEHKAKTAGKDAARAQRYAAHKAATADKDAARGQRLIDHRNAQAVKKAGSAYATVPIAPIEGPSALDLETHDFAFRFKHGWIRIGAEGDKPLVSMDAHTGVDGVKKAADPPPMSATMKMAWAGQVAKAQRILDTPIPADVSPTMKMSYDAQKAKAQRTLDEAKAAGVTASATEFATPNLTNLPKGTPLVHGTAQIARTGDDGTVSYTDGYVYNPKTNQTDLPADPKTGQPMNQADAKALLKSQLADDAAKAAESKAEATQQKQTAAQQKAAAAAQAKQTAANAAAQKKAATAATAAQKKAATAAKPATAAKSSSTAKPASSGSSSGRTYNRTPAGQAGGGRFAPGPARNGAAAQVQADPAAQALYSSILGASAGARPGAVGKLSDGDLKKATQILYSSKTSDPNVVNSRIAVANEMSKRGFDVKHYGALGGGLSAVKNSPVVHAAPAKAAGPGAKALANTEMGLVMAADGEFAWNPDIRPADKHGRPIAKGHKVLSATGEQGTVVGNAPARGKNIVQVSVPKGSPVSVPAEETEVVSPPEQPGALNDLELADRHAKISADIAGHHQKQADDAKAAADDPTATVADDPHQPEIDRLKAKRAPYAAELTKRKGAQSTDGDTVTASAANDPELGNFTYHWNPESQETFRIAENGDISVFAPALDEQEQPSWQAIDTYNGSTQVADVANLPKIEDHDTLEVILGSSLALVADAGAAPAVQEVGEIEGEMPEEEPAEDTKGRRFRIPILIPEGVPSGDRRQFADGALEAKEPPMPLLWQRETDDGHKRSVTVGRIDKIERLESGGLGQAEGVFDTHADAQEAARQVRERFLTGVSGDVDQFEAELSQSEGGDDSLLIKHGRLVAATLVAKPAFQEATIEMIPEEGESTVITASGGPLLPPKAWFFKPSLDGPTPLQVNEDGRVFGHIAEWGTPHLGNPQLKPPRSTTNYRYFNRKPLRTAEGEDIRVGNLTLVGGHAKMSFDPDRAVKHYDDTQSAVADVVAGEDEFGIWVAGAMRPGVTPEQVRAFRASEPSGDWRMRDGNLELCAICQVNVAGFPVTPRALVASGEVVALVAAGMVGHETKQRAVAETVAELAAQVAELRAEREAERRAALLETVQSLRR